MYTDHRLTVSRWARGLPPPCRPPPPPPKAEHCQKADPRPNKADLRSPKADPLPPNADPSKGKRPAPPPPPPCEQNDTCLWKHYLPSFTTLCRRLRPITVLAFPRCSICVTKWIHFKDHTSLILHTPEWFIVRIWTYSIMSVRFLNANHILVLKAMRCQKLQRAMKCR